MKKQTSERWKTVPNEHWGLAQDMRKSPTYAEHVLWQILRQRKLGVSFRRQHPVGPYIADFICLELGLVIEVDGDVHEEPPQKEHDAARSAYLSKRGLHVLRFANDEVLWDLDRVVMKIEKLLATARQE